MARNVFDQTLSNAQIDTLLQILDQVDTATRDEVLRALSVRITQATKTASLSQIRRIIQAADAETKSWIVRTMSQAYVDGINVASTQLRRTGVTVPGGRVTVEHIRTLDVFSFHKDAVNALISDSYLDFAHGMNGLLRGAEHQINEALKRQMRAQIISGQLTGAGIGEIRSEIVQILGDQGFSVLRDRSGRQWTLDRYGEMLARSQIIASANEGLVNRAAEFEIDLVEWITAADERTCRICEPLDQKIFSLSGKSEKYPKLEEIPGRIHPNCRCALGMRPDLEDKVA